MTHLYNATWFASAGPEGGEREKEKGERMGDCFLAI